ncbi:MAG: sensor histidine kinase [Planctomycetaceae bacterium]
MTRLRPALTWLAFGVCLAAVGGAMLWMSGTMLRQEREGADNDALARRAENERLALWRMESALVPLIAHESSHPPYAFRSFYSPEVLSRWFTKVEKGEIQLASELLVDDSPHVLIHFEVRPDGTVTSPQVPTGNMRDVAELSYTTHEKINAAERRLKEVAPLLVRAFSSPSTPRSVPPTRVAQNDARGPAANSPDVQQAANPPGQRGQIAARNAAEFEKRQQTGRQLVNDYAKKTIGKNEKLEPMKALWVEDRLVLARESRRNGRRVVQGCVLNWTTIQRWLAAEVTDLLPDCQLVPVKAAAGGPPSSPVLGVGETGGQRLASIPVRVRTGEVPAASLPVFTPMRLSLGIAWLCFLLAAGAVASLLRATIRLSERRGAFVSAVTHELRTPLTTFRMYTEMLSRGMVSEERKAAYLDTLSLEADRLGHLVENVLSYARLESPRKRPASEEFALDSVLERMRASLQRRVDEAGMTLDWQCNGDASVNVRADAAAVERIVFNLVDNACKYARNARDRTVHLECVAEGSQAVVSVRDHGPGVSAEVEKRMFLPFSKSDREAANSAPGIGLGLSLSRGLARNMGGDLKLDRHTPDGARFELLLPLRRTS